MNLYDPARCGSNCYSVILKLTFGDICVKSVCEYNRTPLMISYYSMLVAILAMPC